MEVATAASGMEDEMVEVVLEIPTITIKAKGKAMAFALAAPSYRKDLDEAIRRIFSVEHDDPLFFQKEGHEPCVEFIHTLVAGQTYELNNISKPSVQPQSFVSTRTNPQQYFFSLLSFLVGASSEEAVRTVLQPICDAATDDTDANTDCRRLHPRVIHRDLSETTSELRHRTTTRL